MQTIGTWIAALGTVAIFSYLFTETFAFRLCEHVMIGTAAALVLVRGFEAVRASAWTPLVSEGQYKFLVPLIVGGLLYTRFFKQIAWVSRISVGFVLGGAAALALWRGLTSEVLTQITATTKLSLTNVNNVVYVLCVVLSISAFLFVAKEDTPYGKTVKHLAFLGRGALMIAFGSALGTSVMARISILIPRLRFLLVDWLKIGM